MNKWKVSDKKTLILSDEYIGTIDNTAFIDLNKMNEGKIYKIPFRYIKTVELNDDKNKLIISFNKESYEEVKITNPECKKPILESFKKISILKGYEYGKKSVFEVIKKPTIAALILSVIFMFSYMSAIELEKGNSIYNHVFVVWLAGLGTSRLITIYSIIIVIILSSIGLKIKNNSPVHKFIFI